MKAFWKFMFDAWKNTVVCDFSKLETFLWKANKFKELNKFDIKYNLFEVRDKIFVVRKYKIITNCKKDTKNINNTQKIRQLTLK